MIARRPRAILFDLDGTILDTAPDMGGALNALRAEARRPALPLESIRPHVSHGATRLVQLGFPEATDEAFPVLRARFLELYHARGHRETRLFEGVETVLGELEAAQLQWGIVTNKPGWLTAPLLEHLSLEKRARVVVCGDTLTERKPHPAPLLHAANILGVQAGECLYIGDAERDVLAARSAGMPVYVALFGYIPSSEQPRSWPASGWLESPRELAGFVSNLIQRGTKLAGSNGIA